MDIDIDLALSEPVYEQIVRQIQQGVRLGVLKPGTPLPSIRQLAHDLDLNHNTIAKAYKILENNRVIRTAGQKGTFIEHDAAAQIDTRNQQDAAYLLTNLARSLRERGLTLGQIQAAFQTAISDLAPTSKENK